MPDPRRRRPASAAPTSNCSAGTRNSPACPVTSSSASSSRPLERTPTGSAAGSRRRNHRRLRPLPRMPDRWTRALRRAQRPGHPRPRRRVRRVPRAAVRSTCTQCRTRSTISTAVFVEPAAAAYRVAEQVQIERRTRAAVVGAGRLGVLVAQVLRERGAETVVFVRSDGSRGLCTALGLDAASLDSVESMARQFDLVVDATGAPEGFARRGRWCGRAAPSF